MKKLFIIFFMLLIFSDSNSDVVPSWQGSRGRYVQVLQYKPILLDKEKLRSSVFFSESKNLINPGKIYFKDNYIFVNEKYKGVHVIDNHDPKDPKNIGFINAPGCIDIAMKENTLYLDNAIDLVAVNIKNFPYIKVTQRIKDIFPELLPPDQDYIPWEFNSLNRPENTAIVEWIKK